VRVRPEIRRRAAQRWRGPVDWGAIPSVPLEKTRARAILLILGDLDGLPVLGWGDVASSDSLNSDVRHALLALEKAC
jgi:hypothetical protein